MNTISNNGITHLSSSDSVDEVLDRLLSLLKAKAITVFAVVDHSGEAAKVGLEMNATRLVIFGSPKAGTPLMVAAPDSALDLPLKILIAAGPDGTTRVSYNTPAYLQNRYGFTSELLGNIAGLEQIASAAAG